MSERLTTRQLIRQIDPAALETRSAVLDVPQKVFIDRIDDEFHTTEYSEEGPMGLRQRIHDLLYGEYASANWIELFYCLPEIFAPIHEIASRVADANWELRSYRTDAVDYNNADFNRLFSKPNALFTHRDMVYSAVCYEILTGKQLWYFNRTDVFGIEDVAKSVIAWWNLPAHRVLGDIKQNFDPYTSTDISDFILQWKMSWNGRPKTFQTKDVLPVLHLDLNHSTNVNRTMAMIQGASKAVKNLIPVYEARGTIYVKRGAMGFIVSRKKSFEQGSVTLTKTEKDAVNKDVNSRFGLTGNKQTIGVVGEDVDFVKTGMSIAEMLPFDETTANAAAIYAVLRVPSHLIPSKDKSTFNNANADLKSFYTDVIIPWAQRYAQLWTEYFGFKNRYIFANYNHQQILQDNKKDEAFAKQLDGGVWLERWSNSACSLNEWIMANNGTVGTGPMFDKKLLEMTPEELLTAQSIINIKAKQNANNNQDTGNGSGGNSGNPQKGT